MSGEIVKIPYTTKEIINADLHLSEEELDEALKQLEAMHLITIQDDKIFDVEESFNALARKWKNS